MFRVVFDREGFQVFDFNVGETDINQGISDSNFEASETAVLYDGSALKSFSGVSACVADRDTYAVTK